MLSQRRMLMPDYISSELSEADKNSWSTPQWLFDALNKEFDFVLDAAANHHNTKCDHYITAEEDALNIAWAEQTDFYILDGKSVWVNPPYSKGMVGAFIDKAIEEIDILPDLKDGDSYC
jgi:phage N-6-adenine-methyltransferase